MKIIALLMRPLAALTGIVVGVIALILTPYYELCSFIKKCEQENWMTGQIVYVTLLFALPLIIFRLFALIIVLPLEGFLTGLLHGWSLTFAFPAEVIRRYNH